MVLIQPDHLKICGISPGKAVANGPVGQVLAGPLFLKVKQSSILQKASNKQKY